MSAGRAANVLKVATNSQQIINALFGIGFLVERLIFVSMSSAALCESRLLASIVHEQV